MRSIVMEWLITNDSLLMNDHSVKERKTINDHFLSP